MSTRGRILAVLLLAILAIGGPCGLQENNPCVSLGEHAFGC
jgi:hypothetical protein